MSFAQGNNAAGPYHLLKMIAVGQDTKWDYLSFDGNTHRLFVAHGDRVTVISTETDAVIGEVAPTPGVHGAVVASDLHQGFTSNGHTNSVSIFDPVTLAIRDSVHVGKDPDAIVYEPVSKKIFTFNGDGNDATVIDAHSGKYILKISLGGTPEFATADSTGLIYNCVESANEIAVINAKTLKVEHRWATGDGQKPKGIAIDRENHVLFIGCANGKMIVMDAPTGKILATLPIGLRVDATAYNPIAHLAYSSNGDGTLTVVKKNGDKYEVAENVQTQLGARTMAVDAEHDVIYLATASFEPPSQANTKPKAIPGTFVVLKYGRQ